MGKSVFLSICFIMYAFSVNAVHGQGFEGPGSRTNTGRRVQTVTVTQARNLADNSLVIEPLAKLG